MLKQNFDDCLWNLAKAGLTPNHITLWRVPFCIMGWLIWIYQRELEHYLGFSWKTIGSLAVVIIAIAIVADLLDGYFARLTNQVTENGKVIDPLTDKFITYGTLVLFWTNIDKLILLTLFSLDICSTLLRKIKTEGANNYGKYKAFLQNIAIGFFGFTVLLEKPKIFSIANGILLIALCFAILSVGIRLRRYWRYLIPNLITAGNASAGISACYLAITGEIEKAILCTFLAIILDFMDGIIARKLNALSLFGAKFDSFADFVSFGITPAVIVISLIAIKETFLLFCMTCLLGIVYIIATMYRLSDYNRNADLAPQGFFRGMPSTAGGWLVIAVTGLALKYEHPFWLLSAFLAVTALCMCIFPLNWEKFSSAVKTLSKKEITACFFLSMMGIAIAPLGFLIGPILVYWFSPLWRRPKTAT